MHLDLDQRNYVNVMSFFCMFLLRCGPNNCANILVHPIQQLYECKKYKYYNYIEIFVFIFV